MLSVNMWLHLADANLQIHLVSYVNKHMFANTTAIVIHNINTLSMMCLQMISYNTSIKG